MSYADFLDRKLQAGSLSGFPPTELPGWLFDFQAQLVDWAVRKGRAAIFADCGLGKSPMLLVWAQNVVAHTNRPVLVLAPLAASAQLVREAAKFGLPCVRSLDGRLPADARIVVSNYERVHRFDPAAFAGVVCDESSILKHFEGATKAAITEFARRLPYRLLCTATAAPNDYVELGTSAEALGELGYIDMLGMFFTNDTGSIEPLSYAAKWRFKPHAQRPFWRWVCSWARALRRPSDLGCDDGPFVLPPLDTRGQVIAASRPFPGCLFVVPAQTLAEQRAERRQTITERCATVAALADHAAPFLAWCHLNAEADMLVRLIPGARQVSGDQPDEEKEETLQAFCDGQLRVLVTKPRIAGFGLNLQHCAHLSVFPSHSYEQYYQAVRRCWRYGQTRPVVVEVVSTAGEGAVLGNLQRKAAAADRMFALLVEHMRDAESRRPTPYLSDTPTLPTWMASA